MARNENTVTLPALPDGQVYIPCLDKNPETFCKYGGEVDKPYTLTIAGLTAESVYNGLAAFWTRAMGTVTVPQEGYPEGITRLIKCDERSIAINANTYAYGSGGGAGKSADWETKFLREQVLRIVMTNLTKYKGRKNDAAKDVADDPAAMFLACCEVRHAAIKGSDDAQTQFDTFYPVQVAGAKTRADEKLAHDRALSNAFSLPDDFSPDAS